jgi:peptide deformylase
VTEVPKFGLLFDMAILDVKIIPDPILRVSTERVTVFDQKLHTFLDDMYETMIDAIGIGLAAPQVGSTQRIAIMDLTIEGVPYPTITSLSGKDASAHVHQGRLELINAALVSKGAIVASDEGCLSIPEYRDSIKRPGTVVVTAQDRNGDEYKVEAEDLTAFCIQHELDHLDGVLFVDHLSRLKMQLFRRWCAKNGFEWQPRIGS